MWFSLTIHSYYLIPCLKLLRLSFLLAFSHLIVHHGTNHPSLEGTNKFYPPPDLNTHQHSKSHHHQLTSFQQKQQAHLTPGNGWFLGPFLHVLLPHIFQGSTWQQVQLRKSQVPRTAQPSIGSCLIHQCSIQGMEVYHTHGLPDILLWSRWRWRFFEANKIVMILQEMHLELRRSWQYHGKSIKSTSGTTA